MPERPCPHIPISIPIPIPILITIPIPNLYTFTREMPANTRHLFDGVGATADNPLRIVWHVVCNHASADCAKVRISLVFLALCLHASRSFQFSPIRFDLGRIDICLASPWWQPHSSLPSVINCFLFMCI